MLPKLTAIDHILVMDMSVMLKQIGSYETFDVVKLFCVVSVEELTYGYWK